MSLSIAQNSMIIFYILFLVSKCCCSLAGFIHSFDNTSNTNIEVSAHSHHITKYNQFQIWTIIYSIVLPRTASYILLYFFAFSTVRFTGHYSMCFRINMITNITYFIKFTSKVTLWSHFFISKENQNNVKKLNSHSKIRRYCYI